MTTDVFCNEKLKTNTELIKISEDILFDMQTDISKKDSIRMPIAEMATLGTAVASILPSMRTITQTTTVQTQGLYRLANESVGDVLKSAKNGNFWAAFKTADGKSKFAQLQSVTSAPATTKTVMPIDPATMMIAVALFSIEKQLGEISETSRQIMSFLERENESKIEADVQTLSNMLIKYKSNWDNEKFISSYHKLAVDIQRSSRANVISYKKAIQDLCSSKELVLVNSKLKSTLQDLEKFFKYYRMSLYVFSMASLSEVLFSGNFKKNYIEEIINELNDYSTEYRNIFTQCSIHLEQLSGRSIEKNIIKGVGAASSFAGNIIASIPLIKEGKVDEFLQDGGKQLKRNADNMEFNLIHGFSAMSNPGISVFIDKLNDLIRIYNDTKEIYFDEKYIYLTA